MVIGIVVGLTAEARIARRLGGRIAVGGGTREGATHATERLVADGARALISFGLAGGLDPHLPAGSIVVPDEVVAGGKRWRTDAGLNAALGGSTGGAVFGGLGIVAEAEAKQRLHGNTGAVAVDLESGAVALIAAKHNLPFAVVRAICDPAHRALPPAATSALSRGGKIGVMRVACAVLRRPWQLGGLMGLARDAATARRALLERVRTIGKLKQRMERG